MMLDSNADATSSVNPSAAVQRLAPPTRMAATDFHPLIAPTPQPQSPPPVATQPTQQSQPSQQPTVSSSGSSVSSYDMAIWNTHSAGWKADHPEANPVQPKPTSAPVVPKTSTPMITKYALFKPTTPVATTPTVDVETLDLSKLAGSTASKPGQFAIIDYKDLANMKSQIGDITNGVDPYTGKMSPTTSVPIIITDKNNSNYSMIPSNITYNPANGQLITTGPTGADYAQLAKRDSQMDAFASDPVKARAAVEAEAEKNRKSYLLSLASQTATGWAPAPVQQQTQTYSNYNTGVNVVDASGAPAGTGSVVRAIRDSSGDIAYKIANGSNGIESTLGRSNFISDQDKQKIQAWANEHPEQQPGYVAPQRDMGRPAEINDTSKYWVFKQQGQYGPYGWTSMGNAASTAQYAANGGIKPGDIYYDPSKGVVTTYS